MASRSFVGIDFSGSAAQWQPNVSRSCIWIAEVEATDAQFELVRLRRVQELSGSGRPFARLVAWLSTCPHESVGIDAPFSLPWWFFSKRIPDHAHLLGHVARLAVRPGEDFPRGRLLVESLTTELDIDFSKPLRVSESYWRGLGVNVRSTVWCGPRPGAPFTSACLRLAALSQCPIWPWAGAGQGALMETFPAAQLRQWRLPFSGYNGPKGRSIRGQVLRHLLEERGLVARKDLLDVLAGDADALDALLCAYGARAASDGRLASPLPPFEAWRLEGWIAVAAS